MDAIIVYSNLDGVEVVSSLQVAEHFEKEHKNVTRSIRSLIDEIDKSMNGGSNLAGRSSASYKYFIPYEFDYTSGNGTVKKAIAYYLTRDGFSLLAMGFTGAKALQWKLKYIEGFNRREDAAKRSIKQAYQISITAVNDEARAYKEESTEVRSLMLQMENYILQKKGYVKKSDVAGMFDEALHLLDKQRENHIKFWKNNNPVHYGLDHRTIKSLTEK